MTVIRYSNEQVLFDIDNVLSDMLLTIDKLKHARYSKNVE